MMEKYYRATHSPVSQLLAAVGEREQLTLSLIEDDDESGEGCENGQWNGRESRRELLRGDLAEKQNRWDHAGGGKGGVDKEKEEEKEEEEEEEEEREEEEEKEDTEVEVEGGMDESVREEGGLKILPLSPELLSLMESVSQSPGSVSRKHALHQPPREQHQHGNGSSNSNNNSNDNNNNNNSQASVLTPLRRLRLHSRGRSVNSTAIGTGSPALSGWLSPDHRVMQRLLEEHQRLNDRIALLERRHTSFCSEFDE